VVGLFEAPVAAPSGSKAAALAARTSWKVACRAMDTVAPGASSSMAVMVCLHVGHSSFESFWCAYRSNLASVEFARFLRSDAHAVRVTRLEGMQAPLNALIPPSYLANATGARLVDGLPVPTAHQRWWSLIPSDQGHGETLPDTKDITAARYWVWVLVIYTGVSSCLASLWSVKRNAPTMLKTVSNTGFQLVNSVAMLTALYTLHWEPSLQLAFCMYVPGWAYFWSMLWLFISALSAAAVFFGITVWNASKALLLLPLCCFVYWLVWLGLPLLVYSFSFTWSFVDSVHSEGADARSGAPFADASVGLHHPFTAGIWTGISVFVVCSFVLPRVNERLVAGDQRAAAAAAAAERGPSMV